MTSMSPILFSCFFIFALPYAIVHNLVSATKSCDFPAIFNFGDSNSDTGGNAAAFGWPKPPNGVTYFNMPAGRYSDGRLIIDFIATSFGLPFLSAYLNSLGANFSHGANFASAGSTVTKPAFNPFYLDVQYRHYAQFMNRSQIIKKRGGIYKDLMPEEEFFRKGLFTFDMGQNDLNRYLGDKTIEEIIDTVPYIVNNFSTTIKNIYNLGGRSFWIHNTGPIGCLTKIWTKFPTDEMDSAGCAIPYNALAKYFNYKLKKVIVQLRNDLPLASITYVDVYSIKYSFFAEPQKYGFDNPHVICCGYGGKYNYSNVGGCGDTINVNGSQIYIGSCGRPSSRVIWDGIHYTEAANHFVFEKISTGEFSDPPIPLRMACHTKLD